MDMRKRPHCTFLVCCHVIFVVKYRRPCINDEIGDFLIRESKRLLDGWDAELVEANTNKDHMHLLISFDPRRNISDLIGSVKGVLSRLVRKEYGGYLKEWLWGDSFWTDSYYIASVGNASEETIRNYIESQGKPKRAYHWKNKKSNSSPPQSID